MVAHESIDRNPKNCRHVAWLGQLGLPCGVDDVDNGNDDDYDDDDDDDDDDNMMTMKTMWLCRIRQSDYSKDDHCGEGQPSHHCREHLQIYF